MPENTGGGGICLIYARHVVVYITIYTGVGIGRTNMGRG